MADLKLKGKMLKATKWSVITELLSRLVAPLTNMVLARLLTPDAFGVVATVVMIVSFADMLTDAGFQKYLVQHEFNNEDEKYNYATVAFWTNFSISVFFCFIIVLFNAPIAALVGNPGLGIVVAVSCIQLPITSFSSIQTALYRRDFDYKTLFTVRIVSVFIPFVVTIPLALMHFSYWSLIIGTICGYLSNAIILTVKSKWKPTFFYNKEMLKKMLSFSLWSLIEAISIWLTTWVDSLIIGSMLSSYYLGIYKTSVGMVSALMGIITASTTTVLFSTLSRLQDNKQEFNSVFLKTQQFVSILVLPLGVGVFLFRDLATHLFLGKQWGDATDVIGLWALTNAITIVLGYYCSEVYRAKGKPKLSFLVQVLYLIVLIPISIFSSRYGFRVFLYARTASVFEFVLVHLIIVKFVTGITISRILKNIYPTSVGAALMGCFGYILQKVSTGFLWSIVSIVLCTLFYFGILLCFSEMRIILLNLFSRFILDRFKMLSQRRKVVSKEV